jgi:hypothetical protein
VVGALDQNMSWGGTEELHCPTIIYVILIFMVAALL